jgi:hypothetical protein
VPPIGVDAVVFQLVVLQPAIGDVQPWYGTYGTHALPTHASVAGAQECPHDAQWSWERVRSKQPLPQSVSVAPHVQ